MKLLTDRFIATSAAAILALLLSAGLAAAAEGCLTCHEGIERFSEGDMQDTIEAMGADLGDPGGCVVCHGGNPEATEAEAAISRRTTARNRRLCSSASTAVSRSSAS